MARALVKGWSPDPRVRIILVIFSPVVVSFYSPILLIGLAAICALALVFMLRKPAGYGTGVRLLVVLVAYIWLSHFSVLMLGGSGVAESVLASLYQSAQFVVLAFPLALWTHSSFIEINTSLHWLLSPLPVRSRFFVAYLLTETVYMLVLIPRNYRFRRVLLAERGVSMLRSPFIWFRTMVPDFLADIIRTARDRARYLHLSDKKMGPVSGGFRMPMGAGFFIELFGAALLVVCLLALPQLVNHLELLGP